MLWGTGIDSGTVELVEVLLMVEVWVKQTKDAEAVTSLEVVVIKVGTILCRTLATVWPLRFK